MLLSELLCALPRELVQRNAEVILLDRGQPVLRGGLVNVPAAPTFDLAVRLDTDEGPRTDAVAIPGMRETHWNVTAMDFRSRFGMPLSPSVV